MRPGLADLRADAVDLSLHVDPVRTARSREYSIDQVLVEEAEGLLGGRGGQADQEGVEVLQHAAPQVVDGAVALVHHDEIVGLDGNSGL